MKSNSLPILYIEDHDFTRDQVLEMSDGNTYTHVLAPSTRAECEAYIASHKFQAALIDINLKYWVEDSKPIVINGTECYTGIEITKALNAVDNSLPIGVFSSNSVELNRFGEKLKESEMASSVSIVNESKDNTVKYDHLRNFLDVKHLITVQVQPLFIKKEIPFEIGVYFARKLLKSTNRGEYIWKAGEYVWLVGVNQTVSKHNHEFKMVPPDTYYISINKTEFCIESIENSNNCVIVGADADSKSFQTKQDILIHDLFLTNRLCNDYVCQRIRFGELCKTLTSLGDFALLESQRYLYKNASSMHGVCSKEEIYEILSEFRSRNFPRILDIFVGDVSSVDDNFGHIKLTSLSPENPVFAKHVKKDLLSVLYLEEGSSFEYIVYEPTVGGTASLIEPI